MENNSQQCPYCNFIGDHIVIAVDKGTFIHNCRSCGKKFFSVELSPCKLWKQFVRAQGKPKNENFIREVSE